MIYLDAAATTAMPRPVVEAMWPHLTSGFGNPSSHNDLGDAASAALTEAREVVAHWLGCRAAEVIFTSGGTEADNLAIKGIALANPRGRHIVTSAIEHEAVLESCAYLERHHGFEVDYIEVDSDGRLDLARFEAALRDDTSLCSVMMANNEVGTVQPLDEVVALAHARGALVHTDAVQAAGWLDLDVAASGVDALSVSGHKLGAPKGIGALFVRSRLALEPVLHGGGQERGARSGTENVAGAVGLAAAIAHGRGGFALDGATTRDDFIARVLARVPGAILTGHPIDRLPAHASFCFTGTSGEAVLLELERRGVVCSSGSACAAGSDAPSHVLLAMGIEPTVAQTAVRFTWSADVTPDDFDTAADAVLASVLAVRGLARA